MTIGQLKKETLALIEEYNGEATFTDDADLKAKLNYAINTIQTELALSVAPIIKKSTIAKASESDLSSNLPSDFYQLYKLAECSFDIFTSTIEFNNDYVGNINMYYKAYPTRIIDTTLDTVELEIDRNAQEIMKWGVASEILKMDPAIDYGIFEAKYQNLKANIDSRKNGNVIQIVSLEPSRNYF